MSRAEPPSPARHLIHDSKDLFLVLVVGGGGCGIGVVWAWTAVAGAFAGAAPRLGVDDALRVLGRLPQHWADPRQAWPPALRSDLPGPAGCYLAAVLVLLVAGAVVGGAAWAWARWKRRPDGFATRRQLATHLAAAAVIARGTTVRPSLRGRLLVVNDVGVRLGRSHPDKVELAVSAEDSVLVFAAPRQGKTSQVLIPWVTTWPGPALVTSIRSDVLAATAILRETNPGGPVAVMAPAGQVDWPDLAAWSPTSGCADLDKARQRAEVMVTIGRAGQQDSSNAGYFGANAVNLLTLWLHAAALSGRGMNDVLHWCLDESDQTPVEELRDHEEAAAPGAAELLDGLYRTPPETKSGLWTTVQTALAPLLSPTAQRAFCPPDGVGIDLDAFLRSNGTLYMVVDVDEGRALAPLISAFVDEVIRTARRHADASPGGRLDPPLGMFLDEIANFTPLPSLPALMSFSGGSGIFITGVLQSRAQTEERWGRDGAAMLWGAATVKVILGGLSGEEPRQISELAGQFEKTQVTYHRADDGSISTQTSTQDKPVLEPAQIRCLDPTRREALILHATTPAVKVHMVRHYEGPRRDDHARAEQEARKRMEQAKATLEATP